MPIDTSIYANIKQPTQYSLGDIMGIATGAQNLATGKIEQKRKGVALEQEQGGLDARKAIGAVMTDPQFRDPETGLFDLNKLAPAVYSADPNLYHAKEALSGAAQANNDTITVKKNAIGLADNVRTLIGSAVGSLANDPQVSADKVKEVLGLLKEHAPVAGPMIDVFGRHVDAIVAKNPAALPAYLMQARSQVMPAATQQQMQTPSGIQVDNGQQSAVVNTNPGAGPVGSVIPGTPVQKQLPPTTPVFDASTNRPGYLGPQGDVGAPGGVIPPAVQEGRDQYRLRVLQDELAREQSNPDPAARAQNIQALQTEIAATQRGLAPRPPGGRPFVASGPALGTEQNTAGTVKTVNDDWTATNESARTASQDIGVLQNIKKFAGGAVTGVANERRAYLTGLGGLLGIDPAQLEKTNTDLLAKNSAMLALAGGNTDLARTIAESANPNTHMTKEAIQDAANQVIAQRKLALAKQQYMSHFKGDPESYTKELAAFNQIADPRILQLPDLSREEKARMKAAMSPSEQREFGQKIRKMQAIGLVQ